MDSRLIFMAMSLFSFLHWDLFKILGSWLNKVILTIQGDASVPIGNELF